MKGVRHEDKTRQTNPGHQNSSRKVEITLESSAHSCPQSFAMLTFTLLYP